MSTVLDVSDGEWPGLVRGIAPLGTKAAVFTAGGALFHFDSRGALAHQLGTLLSAFAAPRSVVVDQRVASLARPAVSVASWVAQRFCAALAVEERGPNFA